MRSGRGRPGGESRPQRPETGEISTYRDRDRLE